MGVFLFQGTILVTVIMEIVEAVVTAVAIRATVGEEEERE